MKSVIKLVLITALSCWVMSSVSAVTLVDTGAGPDVGGFSLSSGQWVGAEFSLADDATLTDIYGWIHAGGPFGVLGTAHVGIYSSAGDVPGTELYSSQFSVASPSAAWNGLSGTSWFLSSGDYWVTFEVRSGDTMAGEIPYLSGDPPPPLLNEAFFTSTSGGSFWVAYDSLGLGVRIEGVVPEPATALLLGLGLAGLTAVRGKFSERRGISPV